MNEDLVRETTKINIPTKQKLHCGFWDMPAPIKLDDRSSEEKLEQLITQIGEKEFIRLIRILGYKLIDKDKFYGRNKSNSNCIALSKESI